MNKKEEEVGRSTGGNEVIDDEHRAVSRAPHERHAPTRATAIGVNHVALEVDDVDATLAFLSDIFEFELRGRGEGRAFVDLGDQFIALFEGRDAPADAHRHFGLVVDDAQAVRRRLESLGVELLPGPFLDFLDPSGNRIQVVEYGEIQFRKHPDVAASMGAEALEPRS